MRAAVCRTSTLIALVSILISCASHGGGPITVTTRRSPSSTSRSERLSSSFLSWPEGSILVEVRLRTLAASRAASRVKSRAVVRDQ